MGKPNKTRDELTLADFIKLRGSRWKAKLKEAEVDVHDIIDAIDEAVLDIPQIINMKAIWVFDTIELTNVVDWTDVLYSKFIEYEDNIPEVEVLGGSAQAPLAADIPTDVVPLQNSALFETEKDLAEGIINLDTIKKDIMYYRKEIDKKLTNRYKHELANEDFREAIELLKVAPQETFSVANTFEEISKWCQDNGAFFYDMKTYKRFDIMNKHKKVKEQYYRCVIVIPPMLITNINNPAVEKCTSQPLHFDFTVFINNSKPYYTFEPSFRGNMIEASSRDYSSVKHSHVSDYICWGDKLDEITSKAMIDLDATTILDSIVKLISHHNSESPFCTWDELVESFSYESLLSRYSIRDKVRVVLNKVMNMNMIGASGYSDDFTTAVSTLLPMQVTLEHFLGKELHDKFITMNDSTIPLDNYALGNMLPHDSTTWEIPTVATTQTNSRCRVVEYGANGDRVRGIFGRQYITLDEYEFLYDITSIQYGVRPSQTTQLFEILNKLWCRRYTTIDDLLKLKAEGNNMSSPRLILETGKVLEANDIKNLIGEQNDNSTSENTAETEEPEEPEEPEEDIFVDCTN